MTEVELYGLLQGELEHAGNIMRDITQIMFAFLVASYLVGAKLTRPQLGIIVGIYAVHFLNSMIILRTTVGRSTDLSQKIFQLNPEYQQLLVDGGVTSIRLGIFIAFFVASLVFLFQIRRGAQKKVELS